MMQDEKARQVDQVLYEIVEEWYERVKEHYVTEDDGRELGVEPEIKVFHDFANHRIKFARKKELDVTYGLGLKNDRGALSVESSVNNKSEGFDYDLFIERLNSYYWRTRHEKPWTYPGFDHFAYEDLVSFEPRMGQSISLDIRKDKADILRLSFQINPRHEAFLLERKDLLRDLIENYCLSPLKRIYAEAYREV